MSWSIGCVGKPEAVIQYVQKEALKQQGNCKIEFDAAMGPIIELLKQNYVTPAGEKVGYTQSLVKLDASGSGSVGSDGELSRTCSVKLTPFYENLVQ